MLYSDRLTLTLLIVLPSLIAIQPGQAQITPDNSLGQERSLVNTQDELTDLIEGGAIRGDNLFHSFSEFNVGNDRAVYFASPDSIANILTRVTGNDLSNIFGTLGVEGTANLFLLNPHGIVLGENAMLDLSGSFLATTADSYIFKNDFAYSATNPAIPPLLTVNIPVGLQFGTTAQPITVQTQSADFNEFDSPLGIGVAPQKNITLIGGNLEFTGGYLNAPEGSINLGSVAPDSFVEIRPASTDWTVNYQAVPDFQDITITEGAAIDSSGNSSGSINIQAKNFSVLESSQLKANNYAEASGANITINATETVKISDLNSDLDIDGISGNIIANAFGTGKGADLKIEAKSLQISDRGAIVTSSRESGNAGKIEIDVDQLAVNSNGFIKSTAASRGNAGDVVIAANSLELSGTGDGINQPSHIASTTVDRGNSGKIELNLGQVITQVASYKMRSLG